MTYHRPSFEDDLFTAKVYKRNYRNPQSQRQRRKEPDRDDETIVPQSCGQQDISEVFELPRGRRSHWITNTVTCAKTSGQHARENAFFSPQDRVLVETTIDITYESYEPFSEDLGHRIPPVPTYYKNLVMACCWK